MKKISYIFLAFAIISIWPVSVQAQSTDEEKARAVIEKINQLENECFPAQSSAGLQKSSGVKDGKEYEYYSSEYYQKARFSIVTNDFSPEEKKAMPDMDKIEKWYNHTHNVFNIVAHGGVKPGTKVSSNRILVGGQYFTAEEFAPVLLKHLKQYQIILAMKQEPLTIVLHSCFAGQGDNSFAQQLVDILSKDIKNVAVVAGEQIVSFEKDPKTGEVLQDYVISEKDTKRCLDNPKVPVKMSEQPLPWKVFRNGAAPEYGEKDALATVKSINRKYFEFLEKLYKAGKICTGLPTHMKQ